MLGSLTLMICLGVTFHIEKSDRCLLFVRSCIGTIGFTCFAIGVSLIPLLIQNTIINTAPFWASILGWAFLSESLTLMEVAAMAISFGGVLCISLSGHFDPQQDSEVDAVEDNSSSIRLIGCCLVFVTSWCYAAVTAATRKMQKIHFASILFYYSCVAVPATTLLIFGESWINDHPVRFIDYSFKQYGWMTLVSFMNWLGLCCATIAA